jgi:cytochrome P450
MTYDIISEIGFGAPFGFVEQGKDIGGLIHGFHHGLPLFGLISRLYPFTNWIKSTPLKRFVVSSPQDKSGLGILMRFRDKLLAERMNDIKQGKDIGRVDLLQIFLEAKGDDGKPLDLEYVRAEILLVLLAGADTTGTAFQGMICNIMTKPRVYNKMMAEIDNATKNGLLSSMPKYDEVVEHLPYYVACIRETMRLYPSAPNMFPRYVSKPGMDLYGKFAPPGTEIACNPWVSHRDTNIYGEDAEEFRPERWLDPERAKLFNKYNLAFGYGTRICLGRDLAMMELYKAPLQVS